MVTPDSVYDAVAALRRMLGDDTKQPTYIANVPRRGYRLVARVAPSVDALNVRGEISPGLAADAVIATRPAPPSRLSMRWSLIALSIVLVLAAGYVVIGKLWLSKSVTMQHPARHHDGRHGQVDCSPAIR